MKTLALNNCIDYIEDWETLNAYDHNDFYSKCTLKGLSLVEPFKKELLENLIDLTGPQQANLIQYYIVEIYRTASTDFIRHLRDSVNEIDNHNVIQIINLYDEDDPEAFEIIRFLWWLFIEIDLCCQIYKIPLNKLLQDQDIDLSEFFNDPPVTILKENEGKSKSEEKPIAIGKTEKLTIVIVPIFKPEAISAIIEILKDFFNPEQRDQLKKLLESGDKPEKKLFFKDIGNRLTDTFRKLIEHDFITGCKKQDLIHWIIDNFSYLHLGREKSFVYDTVEKIISRDHYPSKFPLIDIINNQIHKVDRPRKRNMRI
jgi:hypothetical protein